VRCGDEPGGPQVHGIFECRDHDTAIQGEDAMTLQPIMTCGHAANATVDGVPCCAICFSVDPVGATTPGNTEIVVGNRTARCTCGVTRPSSEREKLAYFQYRGEGSSEATRRCRNCSYYDRAHDPHEMAKNVPSNRRTVVELGECSGFEPHGAYEFDSFYCGHAGWD
jgi:hypothetical protein